tara:strand:- start:5086 stop:5193 length:108 start_codon:yes stop_codon:yes gene_type:complete
MGQLPTGDCVLVWGFIAQQEAARMRGLFFACRAYK